MQRQTLVPLHHHMRGRAHAGAGMKLLEVACGTGRFATFIKVGPAVLCHDPSCQSPAVQHSEPSADEHQAPEACIRQPSET